MGWARVAYGSALTVAGLGARVLSHVPAGPAAWRGLRDRLGGIDATQRALLQSAPVLWLHAASVGELHAVRPLLARLRARYPDCVQLASTTTQTGLDAARAVPSVQLAVLLPLDAPGIVRHFLTQFRLAAFFFTETEIWPNLLHELADQDVPALMVSGRCRPRPAAQRALLRSLYRPALREVTCCMQSDADAREIIALGADAGRVVVSGSLKFDVDRADVPASVARLRNVLGAGRACIVAGSTHAGEETVLLAAFERLQSVCPDLVLLLAPRHPERLAEVTSELERRRLPWARFSELTAPAATTVIPGPLVMVLDVMGPLAACYRLATVAFVGGTLVPVGGHNLLEPARVAKPIVVGPFTDGIAELLADLVRGGGAIRAGSAEQVTAELARLLADPTLARAMGDRAGAVASGGQGALERHMKVIAARLGAAVRSDVEVE